MRAIGLTLQQGQHHEGDHGLVGAAKEHIVVDLDAADRGVEQVAFVLGDDSSQFDLERVDVLHRQEILLQDVRRLGGAVQKMSNSFLEGGQRLADGNYELLQPIALVGGDSQVDVEEDAEQAGNVD
jgi:hypothetical protein